ncbi:MAG: hypothetical protein RMJ38_05400, partial [candidate division WOR-3 bacterium]|nr:hypothetical protein [candidate division WOR-3 bacterium]MDW8150857.1 hypothetical protein [candidate division WOR-3 bacterium]
NEEVGKEFYDRLLCGKYEYGPYLGINSFLAHIENPKELPNEEVKEVEIIHSPISTKFADKLDVKSNDFIVIEKIPLDFEFVNENEYRKLKNSGDFVANIEAKPLCLKEKVEAILLDGEHILWME